MKAKLTLFERTAKKEENIQRKTAEDKIKRCNRDEIREVYPKQ